MICQVDVYLIRQVCWPKGKYVTVFFASAEKQIQTERLHMKKRIKGELTRQLLDQAFCATIYLSCVLDAEIWVFIASNSINKI